MPDKTQRLIAGGLFAVYVVVNVVLFAVVPTVGDWAYWGEPLRDGLAIGAAIAVGLPLFAVAAGIKPG